jgi:replicative DNA helicase
MGDARLPPHDLTAEQSTLGAMINAPSTIPVVMNILTAGDFWWESNRDIFHEIEKMWTENPDSVDLVTLSAKLPKEKDLICFLSESCITASNAEHYARIVKDLALKRGLIRAGNEYVELGYSNDDALSLLDQAETIISRLKPDNNNDTLRLSSGVRGFLKRLEIGEKPPVVSTGFRALDSMTGGLRQSHFVIVGARPGKGKTALSLAIAQNVSKEGTVLFFSLEMSFDEIMERAYCSTASVLVSKVRSQDVDNDDLSRLYQFAAEMDSCDLRIVDNPTMTMMALKSKARQYARKVDLKLIVVDYIQLLTLGRRAETRFAEVSEISRQLKALARELKVPVLALSQLNRQGVYDNKPTMDQLRESGSLEQDADQVWILYWDNDQIMDDIQDILVVDVQKNRHGPRGEVPIYWNKDTQKFEG